MLCSALKPGHNEEPPAYRDGVFQECDEPFRQMRTVVFIDFSDLPAFLTTC